MDDLQHRSPENTRRSRTASVDVTAGSRRYSPARDRAADLAKALVDRALLRIPDDVRRYLHAVSGPPFAGCELCDDEAGQTGRSAGQRRSTRFGS